MLWTGKRNRQRAGAGRGTGKKRSSVNTARDGRRPPDEPLAIDSVDEFCGIREDWREQNRSSVSYGKGSSTVD